MTLAAKISAAGTRQALSFRFVLLSFSMVFIARGEAKRAIALNLLAPSLVVGQDSRLHPECPYQSERTGREYRSVLVLRELKSPNKRHKRTTQGKILSFPLAQFRGAGQIPGEAKFWLD